MDYKTYTRSDAERWHGLKTCSKSSKPAVNVRKRGQGVKSERTTIYRCASSSAIPPLDCASTRAAFAIRANPIWSVSSLAAKESRT